MKIEYLIVHHTATARDTTTLAAVDRYHRDKNWESDPKKPVARCKISSLGFYTQYHYFIDARGHVTQTARENELRWHAGYMNGRALGICLAGQFDSEKPSDAQIASLRVLLLELTQRLKLSPNVVVPHRTFAKKTCYGSSLPDDWARNVLRTMPPKPLTRKILLVTSKENEIEAEQVRQAMINYAGYLKAVTEGAMELQVDTYDRDDLVFTGEPAIGLSGYDYENIKINIVNTDQIISVGRAGENQNKADYDIVMLAVDPRTILPVEPTNPVQHRITADGFTIALLLLRDTGDVSVLTDTIVHEDLHAWYYQIAYRGGPNLTDDVHRHTSIQDPRPEAQYGDIILKLKNYWPLVTNQGKSLENQSSMQTRNEEVKVYTINIDGAVGVIKVAGGRQIVGELASDPKDYEGLEDNYGVELVKPDGSFVPTDITYKKGA